MSQKRVILAATTHLHHDQRLHRVAASLHKAGFNVTLVGKWQEALGSFQPSYANAHHFSIPARKGPLFYIYFNWLLFKYLLSQPYSIITANDADTLPACWLAAKFKGYPLVFDAHEYFSEVPEVVDRPIITALWQAVERAFISSCDACYTVGGALASHFTTLYHTHFEVIRNMPVVKIPADVASTGQPYFIYTGAVNEGRGLELLLSIWHKVPAELWIVGDGDIKERLEQAMPPTLLRSVKFLGQRPPHELPALCAGAIAGFNLLENRGLSYYYSLANKFFDYVQAGVPQVCIAFPEYIDLNEQHEVAILVNHHEEEVLNAIQQLLDGSSRHRLVANSHLAAKEWCWEQEEAKLVALYNNLNYGF